MADPALALSANGEVIITIIIAGALSALASITPSTTKWRLPATARMAIEEASLALSLIALTTARLITIIGIPTAHTENPELLDRAERTPLPAPFVIHRITARTAALDTERSKALLAVVIAPTDDTGCIPVPIQLTERRSGIAARTIAPITDFTDMIDALAPICWTVVIHRTGHTFRAIIPIDAQPLIASASTIGAQLAGSAGASHTGRGIIGAMGILGTGRTAHATGTGHTEGRLTTAARIIR